VRTPREGKHCTKHWCTAKTVTQTNKKRKRSKTRWSHIENGNEEPVEKCDGDANIGRNPPRDVKSGADEGNLTPVEGESTHSQTMGDPKELVDLGIVWSYPANPRKGRESGEEIGRQEV
jgi:hypothetical protein